jgi:hypothetical protein
MFFSIPIDYEFNKTTDSYLPVTKSIYCYSPSPGLVLCLSTKDFSVYDILSEWPWWDSVYNKRITTLSGTLSAYVYKHHCRPYLYLLNKSVLDFVDVQVCY